MVLKNFTIVTDNSQMNSLKRLAEGLTEHEVGGVGRSELAAVSGTAKS